MVSECGHAARSVYWGLCELAHRHANGNRLRRRVKDVADYCQTRTDKLRRVLDWIRDHPEERNDPGNVPGTRPRIIHKITGEWSGEYLDIEIPKLRERLKKLKTKSSGMEPEKDEHSTQEGKRKGEQKVEQLLRSGPTCNGQRSAERQAALMAQRMPFGEWKDVLIGNLDPGYCDWLLNKSDAGKAIRGTLRDALELRVKLKKDEAAT